MSLLDINASSSSTNPASSQHPQWVNSIFMIVSQLLSLQPTIATHRSKLYSLFDDFRSFVKSFDPDLAVDSFLVKKNCDRFLDVVNRTRQIVYACSSSHWTTAAVSWSHTSVFEYIKRIRADLFTIVHQFGCNATNDFSVSEDELKAQDNVDIRQLKGSLMDYLTTLKEEKVQNQQVQMVQSMINERIKSIGPIDGVEDSSNLTVIPPFLPQHLNYVLNHTDFILGEKIGSGSFGSVYVGTMQNSMKKVAVKVLNVQSLGGRQLETFKREVWTMATLNHPAILRLIGVTLSPPFCIVTELLKDSLYNRMRLLSPTKRSIIALRVSQGLAFLHATRIIHRDLKSSNILLDDDDNPRVCDFGLVGFKKRGTKTGFVGTTQWMAPELLRSSPFYDEKVDVYSFAIMMWELLTLQQPFTGMTQDQIVMAVIEHQARPAIPPQFGPPQLVQLIKSCWAEDPSERPSFEQIASALLRPECHFLGTNEEEFVKNVPQLKLSSELVSAFDTNNWRKLEMLLHEITPDKSEDDVDPDLIPAILSIFWGADSERQAKMLRLLPNLVNFEKFVSMKGYLFIVSCFKLPPVVVDEVINALKTINILSKSFRQQRLITALATSKNRNALQFLSELCKCEDIASHVAKHDIPFPAADDNLGLDNFSDHSILFDVLKIYESLLLHGTVRSFVKPIKQPLILAEILIKEYPKESCNVIALFPLDEQEILWESNILPRVAEVADTEYKGLIVLHKLFATLPESELVKHSIIIQNAIRNHSEFYRDNTLIQKLASFVNIDQTQISSTNMVSLPQNQFPRLSSQNSQTQISQNDPLLEF